MAEKKNGTQEQETVEKTEEKEEETKMAEGTKKETEGEQTPKAKEVKKPNIFKRGWNWTKRHKKEIGACVAGIAAGVGGTLGIEKLGEKWNQKKYSNQPMTQYDEDNEILSPNEE